MNRIDNERFKVMASSPASRSSKHTREMLDHSDTEDESSSCLSPPKKRRGQDLIPAIPSPYSRGKAKIGEDVEYQPHRCGICLSEEGKTVRGWIDICDHYFCFVCIMEWAKVESRCPMCKRRFDTIRRPAKLGVYTSERVVKVPVRDQIYNGFGNSSVCPITPEVGCTVCQSEKDEKHLLLCDLCDAPSHTYCVGLGTTIPEGDWYCDDCSIAMDEHSNSEMNMNSDSLVSSKELPKLTQDEVHVSVFDIVRELVTQSSIITSSPVDSDRTNLDVNNADQGFWRTPTVSSVSTNLGGARTLRRYCNIHSRIKTLRENWNALRTGTLGFSSRTTGNNCDKNEIHAEPHVDNSCATLMASSSASQPIPGNVSFSNAVSHGNSPDIQKAWAMLDAAKLIGQPHSKRSLIPQVPRFPSENNVRSLTNKVVASSSTQLSHGNPIDMLSGDIGHQYQCMYNLQGMSNNGVSSSQLLHGNPVDRLNKDTGYQNQCMHNLQGKSNNGGCKRDVIIDQKPDHSSTKMSSRFCERSQGSEIPRDSTMVSAQSIHCLDKANGGKQHFQGSSKQKAPSSSSTPIKYVQSASLNSSQGPMPEPSNSSVLPDSRIEHSNSKLGIDDGPKAEIRSLVKLNLKLLSTGRELGVDGFKEIARRATHSILAACGLEPPRPGISSFPTGSLCNHRDQFRKSTLMPNCCRECFYVFVKDVVNSIMSERMNI